MLTGIIEEDYRHLIDLYNQYGQVMLTGQKDVDYQILAQLDVQELSRLARINKYTQKLLGDEFWEYKFKLENLDILIKPPSHFNYTWLKLYQIVKQANLNAHYTLGIYNIQYNDLDDPPAIRIYNSDNNSTINAFLKKISINYINDDPIQYLDIFPFNNYSVIEHPINDIEDISIFTMNKQEIIKLLTYCYQFSSPYMNYFNISCDHYPLINNNPRNVRYGILKTIQYYEPRL